jgi:hypothetical protein
MTPNVRTCSNLKNDYCLLWKKCKDKKLTDQSKLTHKALKSRIKEAKTPYYNMKIATSKDRIKTTWNVVKSLTSWSNIQGLINVIKIGDPLLLDWVTISQYFNRHFFSILHRINNFDNNQSCNNINIYIQYLCSTCRTLFWKSKLIK